MVENWNVFTILLLQIVALKAHTNPEVQTFKVHVYFHWPVS